MDLPLPQMETEMERQHLRHLLHLRMPHPRVGAVGVVGARQVTPSTITSTILVKKIHPLRPLPTVMAVRHSIASIQHKLP